jgi:hypothetical protein
MPRSREEQADAGGCLVAEGATEEELGITALRVVATRLVAEPLTWWWTYRVRLAVM